jgi:hypothetical protein
MLFAEKLDISCHRQGENRGRISHSDENCIQRTQPAGVLDLVGTEEPSWRHTGEAGFYLGGDKAKAKYKDNKLTKDFPCL